MLNQTTRIMASTADAISGPTFNSSNKLLFHKNVLTYLKQKLQLLNNEIKKETAFYLPSTTQQMTPASSTTKQFQPAANAINQAMAIECDCSRAIKLSEDYASIWKIGFFTLAFITTFISMLIIIILIIRIMCAKTRNKSKKNTLKTSVKPEKSPKQSCSSLLDYDTGICTMTSSTNFDASKSHNLTSASNASLACKLIKKQNSYLNNDTHSNNTSRCLIYGISNKLILDDISSFYNFETSQLSNGPHAQQVNTIPSSFKPYTNGHTNKINEHSTISLRNDSSSISRKKRTSKSFNDILIQSNEYSAIENSSSLCNVSGLTSYSEVSSEDLSSKIKKKAGSMTGNESDVNFQYLNTNELISSSSILAQELESKLKERRQMIEIGSIKYKPKLFEDESILKREAKIFFENDKPDSAAENLPESAVISMPNCKCVCPCHLKSKSSKEQTNKHQHYRRLSSITSVDLNSVQIDASSLIAEENAKINNVEDEKKNNNNNKKAKIIIDSSSKLPTKRESIRLLIENKAVSENKQKGALECHLNHLKKTLQTSKQSND